MEDMIYTKRSTFSSSSQDAGAVLGLRQFCLIRLLGRSSLGKFSLVKRRDNHQLFVLKVVKKKNLVASQRHTQNGTSSLKDANSVMGIEHPFIAQLYAKFENENKIFYAVEYGLGGTLASLLQQKRVLTENQARFYVAQIYLALDYLHSLGITYKRLWPESILLDDKGYLKLTEGGWQGDSADEIQGLSNLCYLPPELLKSKQDSDASADWWMFGNLIFELVTGLPPFFSMKKEEVEARVCAGHIKYPSSISCDLRDLLQKLLTPEPKTRLTGQSIKHHRWFSQVNWEALAEKSVIAPFIPVLSNPRTLCNLDYIETPSSIFAKSLGTYYITSPKASSMDELSSGSLGTMSVPQKDNSPKNNHQFEDKIRAVNRPKKNRVPRRLALRKKLS